MKKKTSLFKIINWVVTTLFGLLFIVYIVKTRIEMSKYGLGIPLSFIFGALVFHLIIPSILWIVWFFVERDKKGSVIIPITETKVETESSENLEILKNKIQELVDSQVLNTNEGDEKINLINKKIEKLALDKKLREEYETAKQNLDHLKKAGIVTESEYETKLRILKQKDR